MIEKKIGLEKIRRRRKTRKEAKNSRGQVVHIRESSTIDNSRGILLQYQSKGEFFMFGVLASG